MAPTTPGPPTPVQQATAVAGRQFGAISHHQARAAGLTDHQIRGLVARGTWHRRARGLFTVAGSPATAQQATMVAYLAAAPAGGVVSHLSAAALHGLLAFPDVAHVTVPAGISAAHRVACIHRSTVHEPFLRSGISPERKTSLLEIAALYRDAATQIVKTKEGCGVRERMTLGCRRRTNIPTGSR